MTPTARRRQMSGFLFEDNQDHNTNQSPGMKQLRSEPSFCSQGALSSTKMAGILQQGLLQHNGRAESGPVLVGNGHSS